MLVRFVDFIRDIQKTTPFDDFVAVLDEIKG